MQEYLNQNGRITYRISGGSMLPLLRDSKDFVTIRKYNGERLKKYDVAMYDRGGERRYVLHRIVEVGEGWYTFLGDNCAEKEYRIPESIIVGVLESFQRGGKEISVTDRGYLFYSRVWSLLYPVRRPVYLFRSCLSRIPWMRRLYHRLKAK